MKNFRRISVAVLVTVVAIVGIVVAQQKLFSKTKWSDATVRYRISYTDSKGATRVVGQDIRYLKANGEWKEVQQSLDPDGIVQRESALYADSTGLFRVNEGDKLLAYEGVPVGHPSWHYDEQKLRSNPNFVGDGPEIAGLKTLLTKSPRPNGTAAEFYAAPALSGLTLKSTDPQPDGSVMVREAVEVTFGKVADETYGSKPDYPVDYRSFNKGIEAVKSLKKEKEKEE